MFKAALELLGSRDLPTSDPEKRGGLQTHTTTPGFLHVLSNEISSTTRSHKYCEHIAEMNSHL
jgi:hypothetical protein